MKQKNNKLTGPEGFEEYYSEILGDRWKFIKDSFQKENKAVQFKITDALKPYYLDSASVYAALCLPLTEDSEILDLCAAPGGKTLVVAARMGDGSTLSSNERSSDRTRRLRTVVSECLPEGISSRVKVSCSDGSTWCTRQTECFDSILLDAPCSSERHVMLDPKYLNTWSLSRIKTVTTEQWSLLSCACRLLKVGGTLLYSTCALCPQENDGMIERLIKKFNKKNVCFEFLEPKPDKKELEGICDFDFPAIEKTQYGYQILPDSADGAGPIYFSILKKINSIEKK